MTNIEQQLSGGHPNSLGNTIVVVEQVLKNPDLFPKLFDCYFSTDEVVRLRVSNAMKRIAKAKPGFVRPYLPRLLSDIAGIDQASTQWTLAQLFLIFQNDLTPGQRQKAIQIMQKNLAEHHDWIVLNMTMETLGQWAKQDSGLRDWLLPHLERLSGEERKSIAKKARKTMDMLG